MYGDPSCIYGLIRTSTLAKRNEMRGCWNIAPRKQEAKRNRDPSVQKTYSGTRGNAEKQVATVRRNYETPPRPKGIVRPRGPGNRR